MDKTKFNFLQVTNYKKVFFYSINIILLALMISTTSVVAQTPKKTPGKTPPKTQEKKDDKTTETKPEIKKPTIPPAEKKRETVWQLIKKGGWTMLGLGLITSIIIALSLQRVFFFRRQKIIQKDILNVSKQHYRMEVLKKLKKKLRMMIFFYLEY